MTYVDSNPPAVVLTIQNIPFTSYISNDQNIELFFNMRVRQGGGDWVNETDPSDNGYPMQVGTESTVITFTYSSLERVYTASQGPGMEYSHAALGAGYQTDFQLQTMIGYIGRPSPVVPFVWEFYGNTSDWSPIQTLFVPDPSATPAPTPTPTPSPTPTMTPIPTATEKANHNETTQPTTTVIIAIVILEAAALSILLFRRRRAGRVGVVKVPGSLPT